MFTVSKRWRGADVKVVCISEPPKPIKNDADTGSHKDARVQDKRIPRYLNHLRSSVEANTRRFDPL